MYRNIIRSTFLFMSLATAVLALFLNYLEPYMPVLLTRSYRYGKFAINDNHPLVQKSEVPKKWFKHFYMTAAPCSAIVLYWVLQKYLFDSKVSEILLWILDILFGTDRKPLVSAECALLATILLSIQCWKRLYETTCVTIYSDAKMNISHYMAGFIHYFGCLACLIGESAGFVKGSTASFSWDKITTVQLFCSCIFLVSSYTQLQLNFILRKLRNNGDSKTIHTGYKVPHGGLFDHVSGALQFTEIIMYIMLSIILWQSHTYHYVTLWVIINQTECALLSHWWYVKTFKGYPKIRKALIPFVL